ncbi:MAG TPA: 50S ribosomal protein L25 [Candidatus Saccharimonadales bacterium]|nr:50S ribosomal protein L25 [Candidatus Saccharimonadales bacterium]
MEELVVDLEQRSVTGKAVKQLRQDGRTPAVIHDHGKPSIVVMGSQIDLAKAYRQAGKHHPVQLNVAGKRYTALIKAVDIDPKKRRLRHIVFNAVTANEKVTAQIPVHIRFEEGNEATPAERSGLIVLHQLDTVEVEATATNLPDALEFDGEKLVEVGDHATVADLIVPAGVTVKTEAGQSLATVFEPSALQAANESAGGTVEEEAKTEEASGAESTEGEQKAEEAKSEDKKET